MPMPFRTSVKSMISTPQLSTGAILARCSRSGSVPNSGQKSPSPQPQPAGGVVISGTHLGATGGTQTHSRRTRPKLGRLHRARQGLVRVPESNTKYGGKSGKTGGVSRFLLAQVSVSPQGFPREKIVRSGRESGFRPLFTGQVFIAAEGLRERDSRAVTGMAGQACRLRIARCPDKRQSGPRDSRRSDSP